MSAPIGFDATRLTATRFLSGLPASCAAALAACATGIVVGRGEFLAQEGRPADRFFVIERGRVAIELHAPGRGPLIIATVGDGHVVGWSWLFPPRTWHFDAVALAETEAIAFDAPAVLRAADADPELRHELTARVAAAMARRLEGSRMQLLDMYGRRS